MWVLGFSGPQEWLDLFGIRLTLTVCEGSGGTFELRCARSDGDTRFQADVAPVIASSKFHQCHCLPYSH